MADKRKTKKVPYDPHREHESGAFVTFPDDITHKQQELHESAVLKVREANTPNTPAILSRAAVTGALAAGYIVASEGLPTNANEIQDCGERKLYWFAREIGLFMLDLRNISPE